MCAFCPDPVQELLIYFVPAAPIWMHCRASSSTNSGKALSENAGCWHMNCMPAPHAWALSGLLVCRNACRLLYRSSGHHTLCGNYQGVLLIALYSHTINALPGNDFMQGLSYFSKTSRRENGLFWNHLALRAATF